MKTITMYELLGLVKDGKAPKRIKFDNTCWNRINGEKNVYYINDNGTDLFVYFFRKNLTFTLNDEVEILEEEKKIPEKLKLIENSDFVEIPDNRDLMNKINEIIDYLKSKGE